MLHIDEQGFIFDQGQKVDPLSQIDIGFEVLNNLRLAPNHSYQSLFHGRPVTIESYDQPLIAQSAKLLKSHEIELSFNYGYQLLAHTKNLKADAWDRFYGLNEHKIPFVLSPLAQSQLFDQVTSYSDDSLTIDSVTYPIEPLYQTKKQVHLPEFWDACYLDEHSPPGWEVGGPHPMLTYMIEKLKLTKLRVLVIGCGTGSDAALFAQKGHLVTALDFSQKALDLAKQRHSSWSQIQWVKDDIFNFTKSHIGQFDLIFEHTLFCAVHPDQRQKLVSAWSQLLASQGHLMGIFFNTFRTHAPPFGSSQWEVKKLLNTKFRFLYWQSVLEKCPPDRIGKEFFIYAQKVPAS